MASEFSVIKKMVEMVEQGRADISIFAGCIDRVELTTDKGTGVYHTGGLRVGGTVVTLNLMNLSGVRLRTSRTVIEAKVTTPLKFGQSGDVS